MSTGLILGSDWAALISLSLFKLSNIDIGIRLKNPGSVRL